jgi:hypothetical protein
MSEKENRSGAEHPGEGGPFEPQGKLMWRPTEKEEKRLWDPAPAPALTPIANRWLPSRPILEAAGNKATWAVTEVGMTDRNALIAGTLLVTGDEATAAVPVPAPEDISLEASMPPTPYPCSMCSIIMCFNLAVEDDTEVGQGGWGGGGVGRR